MNEKSEYDTEVKRIAKEITFFLEGAKTSPDIACQAYLELFLSTCFVFEIEETDVRDIFKDALEKYRELRERKVIEKLH